MLVTVATLGAQALLFPISSARPSVPETRPRSAELVRLLRFTSPNWVLALLPSARPAISAVTPTVDPLEHLPDSHTQVPQ